MFYSSLAFTWVVSRIGLGVTVLIVVAAIGLTAIFYDYIVNSGDLE